MIKETKDSSQREPKRKGFLIAAIMLFIFGGILTFTIIGAIIGIPLVLAGVVVLILRARVKTKSVECTSCHVPNKVEEKVKYFNCAQCGHTVHA